MLVDELIIRVQGGRGGDGSPAMRRTRRQPLGGPWGGDGGDGGPVILRATRHREDLSHLAGMRRKVFMGESGQPGGENNRTGARGKPLVIEVPRGTLVYELPERKLVAALVGEGEELTVAQGGKGGMGSISLAAGGRLGEGRSERGRPGEKKLLLLDFRALAPVALLDSFETDPPAPLFGAMLGRLEKPWVFYTAPRVLYAKVEFERYPTLLVPQPHPLPAGGEDLMPFAPKHLYWPRLWLVSLMGRQDEERRLAELVLGLCLEHHFPHLARVVLVREEGSEPLGLPPPPEVELAEVATSGAGEDILIKLAPHLRELGGWEEERGQNP